MRAKLKEVKQGLKKRRRQPIPAPGRWLGQVVGGFFGYHAVPTNSAALSALRYHVTNLWRRTLRRRSQKHALTWTRIARLAHAFLPKALIRHPWPSARFAATHPRWEPYALIGPVRICAGGAR
jgi:RNA-directed DNA polymerase